MLQPIITLGNIAEIAIFCLGGLAVLIKQSSHLTYMRQELAEMQNEIKKLGDVLTKIALTDLRLTNVEQDVRELRHGVGFIRGDINGEYDSEGKLKNR